MARAQTVNAPRGNKRPQRSHAAVGYVRRSTDRQEQSIPDQKRAIEHHCDEQGLRLLRFYIDDAISGTSTVGRHAFQSMIEDAGRSACDFGFIVVYDVKRFGRIDNDEAGYYRHILRTHGVDVIYVSENFNGDGTDDLLRPVKQWQAREESKDLAKVTIRGLLSKAASNGGGNANGTSGGTSGGGWMGGAPPFGYDLRYESQSAQFLFSLRYMRDGSKEMFDEDWKLVRTLQRGESVAVSRKDRCVLVPSEQSRVETVRRIFAMYVEEGRGYRSIANVLNREGVPTARGPGWAWKYSGRWSTSSVRSMITNPAYTGDMVWNRRTDARFFCIRDGRAVERRGVCTRRLEHNDEADWIVIPDAHPPLISRRTFEMARPRPRNDPRNSRSDRSRSPRNGQVRAASASSTSTGPRAKFLLSGLGRCSRCGNRYEGYSRYQRRINGVRAKTLHYACGGYIRQGRAVCTLGVVGKELLEQAVIDAIVSFYARYEGSRPMVTQAVERQFGEDHTQIVQRRAELEATIQEIDERIGNLLDTITPSNRQLINRHLDDLSAQREQAETAMESLEHLTPSEEHVTELITQTLSFLAGLEAMLREGPVHQRQAAMRRCVQSIVIDRENEEARIDLRVVPFTGGDRLEAATETTVVTIAMKQPNRQ